jgi:D-alanyl-D-alanine carboxypeptidase
MALIALVSPASFSNESHQINCEETFEIGGKEYPVSERWCGKKLDKLQLADAKKLVKLPWDISFDSSKIYVTKETKQALLKMADAARKSGVELLIDSGFRSIWYQKLIIQRRLEKGEQFEKLITFVAPPGYSEHHTGRAVDFVPSEARFVYTDAYKWLKEHAAEFGFYETWPEDTTGKIPWESWHWVFNK